MNTIPIYPRLISTIRREVEKFEYTHKRKPTAVLLGTDMLGAIVERESTVGGELTTDDFGQIRIEGLLIIPDGRKPGGVVVALL
jgi:hypothetical protein